MQPYEKLTSGFTKLGGKVKDLSRITALLKALGDPQDGLRFVHVAGTNGKGSCAEMLAASLAAAGYKTGLFTSPYIIKYNDRIRINGEDISDEDLNLLAEEVRPHAERLSGLGFSQFEITQAMAFLHFARRRCDVVVLEAGVGGRLDSTNVIAPPLLSVICSVSLDHTAVLGKTVESIAEQKAGIIKKGSPAVLAPENPDSVKEIMRRRAEECGSSLTVPDMSRLEIKNCTAFGSRFRYKGEDYAVSMGGYHQIKNALTVIECAEILRREGYNITKDALQKGLSAQIPARLQTVSRKPFVIIDGGHNPEAVTALAQALGTLECKKRVVMGILADKDADSAAERLAGAADSFICVDGFYPNSLDAERLAEKLRSHGANARASDLSAEETVKKELRLLPEGDALVISGSLFLASLFADGKFIKEVTE